MLKIIPFLLVLFLVGCGGHLKVDPALPAFESNYPTAEFSACGKVHHGLAICQLSEGQDLNSVNLKIQGYYQGTLKLSSPICELDMPEVQRYSDSRLIPIKFKNTVQESCVVEFVVLPEYPKEETDTIETYNFKGILYLKYEDKPLYTDVFKVKKTQDRAMTLNFGDEDGQANIAFFGCNSTYNSYVDVRNGKVVIQLKDIVSTEEQKSCILNGGAKLNGKTYRFTYLFSIYDESFNPLSTCSLEINKKKLNTKCSNEVSIVSLNSEYKIKSEHSFKFDSSKANIFRALTVKGRSVLAIWNPQEKSWTWMQ